MMDNQTWLANVAPEDWINPVPQKKYNLVVIGAGAAGLVTAAATAGLGGKVALVEKHRLGGDCLNVGCVPSKALLAAAHNGENFTSAMQQVRKARADIAPNDSAQRFTDLGVDVFFGEASFTSNKAIVVDGQILNFHKAVIATGGRPALPPVNGLSTANCVTNETLFEIEQQPKSLAIIGAGVIGCEMAQAFQKLGTQVYLFDMANRVLAREDKAAAAIIEKRLLDEGVQLCLSANIDGVTGEGEITFSCNDQAETIATDLILVASGRAANVENLGLENTRVHVSAQGIVVNEQLRTAEKNIYAVGDVCMQHKFTHAADAAARAVVQNAFFFGRKKISNLIIPWTVYTKPELAQVGLTQASAAEQGIAIDTYQHHFTENDRAITECNTAGFVKIYTKRGRGEIVGATVVADNAGDILVPITMAMTEGVGLGSLAKTIFCYPTYSESVKRCADAYNRTKLTPSIAKWFRRWMVFLLKFSR